ncbi:hypothetical protein ABMA27_011501 [Loxostege sticticalis]|uniref:Uncharacterized protein n=1 Tax=Loxostege sticticalis TaxID=481309 RepID=A0ABR3IGH3_LOXSC
MKIFAFAFVSFVTLLAGVVAGPEDFTRTNERFVDGIIVGRIEDLSNNIRERGLDPLKVEENTYELYRLPVTDLFLVDAAVVDVLVEGLSNIVINRINFSILRQRLQLDISLPLITANAGTLHPRSSHPYTRVKLFDSEFHGQLSGSARVEEIRIQVDARVSIGIVSGVSINNLDINFSVKKIESDMNIVLLDHDLSETVNKFLNETLPNNLEKYSDDINKLLGVVIKDVVERRMSNNDSDVERNY